MISPLTSVLPLRPRDFDMYFCLYSGLHIMLIPVISSLTLHFKTEGEKWMEGM